MKRAGVIAVIAFVLVGFLLLAAFGFARFLTQPITEVAGFSVADEGIRCEVRDDGAIVVAIRISALDRWTQLLDAKPPSSAPWMRDGAAAIPATSGDLPDVSSLARELPPAADGFEGIGVPTAADVIMRLVPNESGAAVPDIRLYWSGGEPIYAQTIDSASIRRACSV